MDAHHRIAVWLVQQGVWDTPQESLPLAAGYLKAMALADPAISKQADISIRNFRGGVTHIQITSQLFHDGTPDVLAFSVLGWNMRAFGAVAATFKQLNPAGIVIVGGTHVTNQAHQVFRRFPDIDVVVNGEGELTFQHLLRELLAGRSVCDLGTVDGLSWKDPHGVVITNPDRPRIEDLDIIPSPFRTGAVELTDAAGVFRYDVALIETNRGCPYKCSFCYWGGAVGQRVRAFSRARLREELELFAKLGVHTVVGCDANFGMLPIDVEFVNDLIDIHHRYGFPRAFETSWAKNKSTTFYDIVRRMKNAGLRSSFTLALQSLHPPAIDTMNRRNMRLNEWEELAAWLAREGLDCYAELIWGVPGETVESFLDGYDKLSRWVSRVAVYPMMLLPNTEYHAHKERYGIVSVLGDHDDFEYVLAHQSMSFDDDTRIQRFLFWARVLAENAVLRHIWGPLRELAGLSQPAVLNSFGDWLDTTHEPGADHLRAAVARVRGGGAAPYAAAIGFLFVRPEGDRILRRWWGEAILPRLDTQTVPLLDDVFRYDMLTKPVCPSESGEPARVQDADLSVVEVDGERHYLRRGVVFDHDVPAALDDVRAGRPPRLDPCRTVLDIYYRTGALNAVLSTNHEEIMHFVGRTTAKRREGNKRMSAALAGRGGAVGGPLSFGEEAAWTEFRTDPDTFFKRRAALVVDLPSDLDGDSAGRLVTALCARHDILRTGYETTAGRPVRQVLDGYTHQVVSADAVQPPCRGVDASGLIPADLVSIWLTPTPSGTTTLTFVLNEMITDPWSCARLRDEVNQFLDGGGRFLDAGSEAQAAPPRYADYAREERDRPLADNLVGYWQQLLAGISPAAVGLTHDGPDPSGDVAGELVEILPDSRTQALRRLCRRHRSSPFMTVTALVNTAIAAVTGSRDILLMTTASTRAKRWAQVHGNFTNPVLLHTVLTPEPTFDETLGRSRSAVLGAVGHQPVPYLQLREVLPDEAVLPRPPVRVHYLPRNTHHFDAELNSKPSGSRWREHADVASWPLDLGFAEDARSRVVVWASYDPRAYTHAAVEDLVARLGDLLDVVA